MREWFKGLLRQLTGTVTHLCGHLEEVYGPMVKAIPLRAAPLRLGVHPLDGPSRHEEALPEGHPALPTCMHSRMISPGSTDQSWTVAQHNSEIARCAASHHGTSSKEVVLQQAGGHGLRAGGVKPTRIFRHVGVPVPTLGPVPLMILQEETQRQPGMP